MKARIWLVLAGLLAAMSLLVASILGIAFYLAITAVERVALRWERRDIE